MQRYKENNLEQEPKSKTYNDILHAVSNITEIEISNILSNSKFTEVVDARYLLVYSLYKKGWYKSTISRYTKIPRPTVQRIISLWENRCSNCPILAYYLIKVSS